MAGAVYLLDRVITIDMLSDLPRLVAGVLAGGAIYLLLSMMINRQELKELIQTGRSAIGGQGVSTGRLSGDPAPGISR